MTCGSDGSASSPARWAGVSSPRRWGERVCSAMVGLPDDVRMFRSYSFSPCLQRRPKSRLTAPPRPVARRGFMARGRRRVGRSRRRGRRRRGRRARRPPTRAGLYARVSTHDQQTLPMQTKAMRDHARRRGWRVELVVEDVGSGATERPRRQELLAAARRRPPPRPRRRPRLAAGPLGPIAGRPHRHAGGAGRRGRRVRQHHRGPRSDHARRPGVGRDARGVRRV